MNIEVYVPEDCVNLKRVWYEVVKSAAPRDRPLVVTVSPEPDLVLAVEPMSKLPTAEINSSTELSFEVAEPPPLPFLVKLNLIFPPALKKNLRLFALPKVTECSTVCEPVHLVLDVELCNSEPVDIAETPVEPPATAAAKLCKSVFSAEIIATASPADLAVVDDIDMLVWFATLSIAVNKEFHCEA